MVKPCCAPAAKTVSSTTPTLGSSAPRREVLGELVELSGGKFRMGTPEGEGYPEDGEGPVRTVQLSGYSISRYTATNRDFALFIKETGYRTTAEAEGWSHVFHMLLTPAQRRNQTNVPADTPWWYPTPDACWHTPEGEGSDLAERQDHPVVHISWFDALAYCRWAGCTLPTEAQWEYAARAGSNHRYPWGSRLTPNDQHMCNIWQGRFPGSNTAADGYVSTAPVTTFAANKFGLHNMIGNVWEWCADGFSPTYHGATADSDPFFASDTGLRATRGGSFLCHESYCNRYRAGARTGNAPDTTCSNLGFRVSLNGLKIHK